MTDKVVDVDVYIFHLPCVFALMCVSLILCLTSFPFFFNEIKKSFCGKLRREKTQSTKNQKNQQ